MTNASIKRFTKGFSLNDHHISVRFEPVNIKTKQLYQVYIPYEGKELRCHMQLGDTGFYMTDPGRLPEALRALESVFASAIQQG